MVWQPLPTLEEVLGWSFEDMALKAGELFSELKLTLNLSSDDIQDLVHRFRKHALNGSLFLVLGAQQGFYTAQPDDIRLPQFAWATVWAFAVSINEAASKAVQAAAERAQSDDATSSAGKRLRSDSETSAYSKRTQTHHLSTTNNDVKDLLENYQDLHRLLWGRNKEIRKQLFVERVVEVPKFSTVIPDGARVFVESPDDPGTDEDGEVESFEDNRTEDKNAGDENAKDEPGKYEYTTDLQQEKLTSHATFLSLKAMSADPPGLPCGAHSMYYRDSYRELFEFLLKLEKDDGLAANYPEKPIAREQGKHSRGIIITGQPGIGKTYFGSLLLVERLLRELPTVLQLGTPESGIFHLIFSEGGVCSLGDLLPSNPLFRDVTVWALVDGKPMGGLANFQHRMYKNWLLVSTTSPRPENTKAMQKALSPISIYLPTWTWEELVCATNTQDEPLLRRLYSNFLKYGPIARVLLDELSVINLSERLNILEKQADNTVSNKINACLKLTDLQSILLQQFSTQDSHAVFMMEPVLNDGCSLKLCSIEYAYSFRSEWIAREYLQQASLYTEGHSRMLFEWMSRRPFASSVAGWVFEEQVHVRLGAGGMHTAVILTPHSELENIYTQHNPGKVSEEDKEGLERHKQDALAKATTGTIRIWLNTNAPMPGRSSLFSSYTDLSKLLRESPSSCKFDTGLDGIYLRPAQSNFPVIDGLVVCVESNNYPRAYFFQMTIAKVHPIRALHLYDLWMALPSNVRREPPALVWVVPKSREEEYTKPQPIDDRNSNKISKGLNPKNWPQYRITIDATEFWGNKALGQRVVGDTSAGRYGTRCIEPRTSG